MNKEIKTENAIAILVLLFLGILSLYPFVKSGMVTSLVSDPVSKSTSTCELFMSGIAQEFTEPGLCKKIRPDVIGGTAGFSPAGYQISYERSDCFETLAEETNDKSLCAEVKPISTPNLDGSKINSTECVNKIEQVIKNNWRNGGSGPGPELDDGQLGVIMNKLGYTENDLIQAQAGPPTADNSFNPVSYNSALYDQYRSIRTNADFLNKVENLPSYNEATSTSNRTPNYNEFLYKTVGADLDKPELCGKISPNALVNYPNMVAYYDNSLRDECYHDIAQQFLKPSVCDQMTANVAATPYSVQVNGKYTTEMLNNVQGCKYEITNDVYGVRTRGSASSTPPDETYDGGGVNFAKALSQLGYQVTSTVANPSNSYGWNDYLRDLEFTPAFVTQKNDFITRVNNFQCQ